MKTSREISVIITGYPPERLVQLKRRSQRKVERRAFPWNRVQKSQTKKKSAKRQQDATEVSKDCFAREKTYSVGGKMGEVHFRFGDERKSPPERKKITSENHWRRTNFHRMTIKASRGEHRESSLFRAFARGSRGGLGLLLTRNDPMNTGVTREVTLSGETFAKKMNYGRGLKVSQTAEFFSEE